MSWVDIVAAINMILILGSFFLAVGIISSLRGANAYILAKGWPYILIAVLIFSVIKIYPFALHLPAMVKSLIQISSKESPSGRLRIKSIFSLFFSVKP